LSYHKNSITWVCVWALFMFHVVVVMIIHYSSCIVHRGSWLASITIKLRKYWIVVPKSARRVVCLFGRESQQTSDRATASRATTQHD
jgi:hypothetical protein